MKGTERYVQNMIIIKLIMYNAMLQQHSQSLQGFLFKTMGGAMLQVRREGWLVINKPFNVNVGMIKTQKHKA